MQIIHGSKNFPGNIPHPVVAIGNFDGVHLGHRRIIETAISEALRLKGTSLAYTFDPHPVKILAPAECPPLIQTETQKLAAIEGLGVAICVVEPFTEELARLAPDDFFQTVIVQRLHAEAVVVGYDFTFGVHRKGTVEGLRSLGQRHGIKTIVLEAEFLGERLVSSTNIRLLLGHGEVREAGALLGRPYSIEGEVVQGKGMGSLLEARTANLKSVNEHILKDGVYLTRAAVHKEKSETYPSITSIGTRPTFRDNATTIETHLITTNLDIMGEWMRIEFLEYIRDQIAFDSVDALKKQIRHDIETARAMHLVPLR